MQIKPAIKFLVAASILGLVFWLVDFSELYRTLHAITWTSIFNLSLITLALIYVSALKWGLFIESFGKPVSSIELFRLYVVGYFVNLFMPSYVGGDLVRTFQVGKDVGQHQALSATILERYTGLVAMITLAFLFMWINPIVTWQIELTVIILMLGLIFATILALSEGTVRLIDSVNLFRTVAKHLRKIQSGLQLARRNHKLVLKALALSYLYHSLTVINIVLCADAVGWHNPDVLYLFTLTPIMLLIIALPVAPSALGLQEATFYFFLQLVGASPAQALGVGLVLRAKSMILALLGGLLYKWKPCSQKLPT